MEQKARLPLDLHTHTRLCKHAALVGTREYVDRAAALGLRGLAVCCHNPFKGDNYDIYRMDMADFDTFLEYCEDAKKYAAEKYPDLEIIRTLEVDYVPEKWDETKEFLETRCKDFDAFLGSIHFNSVPEREYLSSLSPTEVLDAYFGRFKEAVKTGFFDVMSHPLFYRKRGYVVDAKKEAECIRSAVELAAREGVSLELNTSAWKIGRGVDGYLDGQAVDLCRDLGVSIAIGSDAHEPGSVGRAFPEAASFLRGHGITSACFFRRHSKVEYAL